MHHDRDNDICFELLGDVVAKMFVQFPLNGSEMPANDNFEKRPDAVKRSGQSGRTKKKKRPVSKPPKE